MGDELQEKQYFVKAYNEIVANSIKFNFISFFN